MTKSKELKKAIEQTNKMEAATDAWLELLPSLERVFKTGFYRGYKEGKESSK